MAEQLQNPHDNYQPKSTEWDFTPDELDVFSRQANKPSKSLELSYRIDEESKLSKEERLALERQASLAAAGDDMAAELERNLRETGMSDYDRIIGQRGLGEKPTQLYLTQDLRQVPAEQASDEDLKFPIK